MKRGHGLNGYKVSYAPKELAEALREAQQSNTILESEPVPAMDVPLPDPTITSQMMGYFGYTDSDMLPLSKDRAMELVEKDISFAQTICLLAHTINSSGVGIVPAEGIFLNNSLPLGLL